MTTVVCTQPPGPVRGPVESRRDQECHRDVGSPAPIGRKSRTHTGFSMSLRRRASLRLFLDCPKTASG